MTGGCVEVAVVAVGTGTIVCVDAVSVTPLVVAGAGVVATRAAAGGTFAAAGGVRVAPLRPRSMTIAPMPITRTSAAAIAIGTIDFFLAGASHGGMGTAAAPTGAGVAAAARAGAGDDAATAAPATAGIG